MGSFTQRLNNLASNPRMVVALSSFAAQSAVGKRPSVKVHGGRVGGFRRFNDFWSVFANRLGAADIHLIHHRGGAHLFDVGGNYGIFSLAMASEHPDATIHTFEPSPGIFSVLQENLRRNNVRQIRINQMAVSDTPGVLKFTVDESCPAMSRLGESVASADARTTTLDVEAVTLDDYCDEQKIDRIGMLKVDVEGAEPKVLRGAARLLKARRIGCIYLEFCPEWLAGMNESPRSLRASLEEAGYQLRELLPDGTPGRPVDLAAVQTCANLLAVPA